MPGQEARLTYGSYAELLEIIKQLACQHGERIMGYGNVYEGLQGQPDPVIRFTYTEDNKEHSIEVICSDSIVANNCFTKLVSNGFAVRIDRHDAIEISPHKVKARFEQQRQEKTQAIIKAEAERKKVIIAFLKWFIPTVITAIATTIAGLSLYLAYEKGRDTDRRLILVEQQLKAGAPVLPASRPHAP